MILSLHEWQLNIETFNEKLNKKIAENIYNQFMVKTKSSFRKYDDLPKIYFTQFL
jgi:hypothetical protein